MQGPNLTSSLLGVLTRFRQHPVTFMGDIQAMLYQVKVPEQDRDAFYGDQMETSVKRLSNTG